jgi:hypothetical protein
MNTEPYVCIEIINTQRNKNKVDRHGRAIPESYYFYRSLRGDSDGTIRPPHHPTHTFRVTNQEYLFLIRGRYGIRTAVDVENKIKGFHRKRVHDVLDDLRALKALLEEDGLLIEYIPESFWNSRKDPVFQKVNHELCITAIQQNANALQFIPDFIKLNPSFMDHFVSLRNRELNRELPLGQLSPRLNVGSTNRFTGSIAARQSVNESGIFTPKLRSHSARRTPSTRLQDQHRPVNEIYSFLGGKSRKKIKNKKG